MFGKVELMTTIEEKYQKKTQREHILLRPDTYIGSTKKVTDEIWVRDSKENRFNFECIEYTPGLYQIFDEILVNAIDHSVVNEDVKNIKITVEDNKITIWNDGQGIPVVQHKEHKMYIPEMIFGHLLTSTNYDDSKARIVGGRNGYGAKLTNIYSKYFEVETMDTKNKKKYFQVWKENMEHKSDPVIKPSVAKKGYTSISFIPDYHRFGLKKMTDDMMRLIEKRAYDAAACTRKDINVYFNGEKLTIKTFERYVDLYIGKKGETKRIYEVKEFRDGAIWEIAACMNSNLEHDKFMQVSFVNGICTEKGGKHIDYILYQITKKLTEHIKEKAKGKNKDIVIKSQFIKERLWLFVRATIVNPAFASQTKDELTTTTRDFGYSFEVSDDFIAKLAKCGIVDEVLNFARLKEEAKLARDTDGRKKNVLRNIPKLDDANFAGSSRSNQCTLILTEGDSAKAFAISGLAVIGRDKYGVFPLKGKPLNVREATQNQLANNQELMYIKQILGLQEGKKYTSVGELRYGRILMLADQDFDGFHIKGLLMNIFHSKWPELLRVKGFVTSMSTPIVKVTRNRNIIPFYTLSEYNEWKQEHNNGRGWKIKYYKGLGTSTAQEAREYFRELDDNQVNYMWTNAKACNDAITLAFDKKKADLRKKWLGEYNPKQIVDSHQREVTFPDFINKELIHFSIYDLQRSIPSVCDGLKPSQRKVMFTCFKENLKSEVKVVELSGSVMKHTAYHHGDMSLNGTIVGLAQNFVGSNNINLLHPQGQFGTRFLGGKDSASPRYITTFLEEVTHKLFVPTDEPLLDYLDDDGKSIEPKWYLPVIPMVLVNGSEGIGTGYSSFVPCYNPKNIINNLLALMEGNSQTEMMPWYSGFSGEIEKNEQPGSYTIKGVFKKTGNTKIEITELPIGIWTTNYKEFLETLTDAGIKAKEKEKKTKTKKEPDALVDTFYEYHTDTRVKFVVHFKDAKKLEELIKSGDILRELKLSKTISVRNMHLWDSKGFIRKYQTPEDILHEFYDVRLEFYKKRREYLIQKLEKELQILSARVNFIEDVIEERIVVFRKKKAFIVEQLMSKEYPIIDNSYDYLISMPLHQFTEEKIADLKHQKEEKEKELEDLKSKTPKELWKSDLVEFAMCYKKWIS